MGPYRHKLNETIRGIVVELDLSENRTKCPAIQEGYLRTPNCAAMTYDRWSCAWCMTLAAWREKNAHVYDFCLFILNQIIYYVIPLLHNAVLYELANFYDCAASSRPHSNSVDFVRYINCRESHPTTARCESSTHAHSKNEEKRMFLFLVGIEFMMLQRHISYRIPAWADSRSNRRQLWMPLLVLLQRIQSNRIRVNQFQNAPAIESSVVLYTNAYVACSRFARSFSCWKWDCCCCCCWPPNTMRYCTICELGCRCDSAPFWQFAHSVMSNTLPSINAKYFHRSPKNDVSAQMSPW